MIAKMQMAGSCVHVALAKADKGDLPKHSLEESASVFPTRSRQCSYGEDAALG